MSQLKVREIFTSIQGEGPFAGRPAVFVRFAGCNLCCPFCDTDHESEVTTYSQEELISAITHASQTEEPAIDLVVFTGGEPMLQNFGPVVKALSWELDSRMDVQVETNGTICPENFPFDMVTIVCSPKPDAAINPVMRQMAQAWKFLVNCGAPVPDLALDIHRREIVYLQPMDEGDPTRNKQNMRWAAALCMRHGFRLSLQMHKIVGVL